jgi:ADP-ribose pyrophosphatase YjhB (NUDIX family)
VDLRTDTLDLWVFVRTELRPRYLLLHTSEEKAARFFGGGRFWQIPGAFLRDGEDVVTALRRVLADLALEVEQIWAVEHTYLIFNRRFQSLVAIPVFASEVREQAAPRLDWEHSDYGWFSADECYDRLSFRGLREGLDWTRREISERSSPRPEFRLG